MKWNNILQQLMDYQADLRHLALVIPTDEFKSPAIIANGRIIDAVMSAARKRKSRLDSIILKNLFFSMLQLRNFDTIILITK